MEVEVVKKMEVVKEVVTISKAESERDKNGRKVGSGD